MADDNIRSYVGEWTKNNPRNYMICYIRDLINDRTITFKTLPESVSETYSSEWSSESVTGRSAPYMAYNGNPSRTVDYSVTLNRDILGDPDFQNTINKCKMLVYPNYAGGGIVTPPYCYVRFGGMIKMFAVVESVSVSWEGPIISGPAVLDYDRNTKRSTTQTSLASSNANYNLMSQAEISFSFTEIRTRGQALPTGNNLNEYGLYYN